MGNYSPYTAKYAQQYGIPADVLDSVVYVGEYDLEGMVEYAAKELRTQYDMDGSGNWANAIDKYSRVTFGAQGDKYAKDIKSTAGMAATGIQSDVGADSGEKWQGIASAAAGPLQAGFFVIFGAVLIILALLTVKPIRNAAVGAVAKGA